MSLRLLSNVRGLEALADRAFLYFLLKPGYRSCCKELQEYNPELLTFAAGNAQELS